METARIFSQPAAEVERQLPQAHPSAYFIYAGRIWDEGRRDDAVFWFYLGQLRFRFHLAAHPSLEPVGDPALFASLVATIGPPINRYAATSLPNWKKQIGRALQWDEATPNLFTSKQTFHKAWQEIRAGLVKLSADLDQHAAAARAPAATGHPAPVAPQPPSRPPPAPPPLAPMPFGWARAGIARHRRDARRRLRGWLQLPAGTALFSDGRSPGEPRDLLRTQRHR